MNQTFSVPDVSCGHCKSAIEGALNPLEGVESAVVDLDGKKVTVSYDESVIPADRIIETMADEGYPVAG